MPSGNVTRLRLTMADALLLAGLMCLYYLARVSLLAGDPLLAWPITDAIMHPERYSPHDLVVSAGVSGNFLLYRLLAALPLLRDNLPLRDFLIYIPIFYLYLLAWWRTFVEVGASRLVAAVAIATLLFSDVKLGLNWSASPLPNLISATSVQFLQVFSLYLFFAGRRGTALILTALSGYLHPATALSFGAVYAVLIARDFLRSRELRRLLPIVAFILIYLPNAIIISQNNQGITQVSQAYLAIFNMFQYHAFLEDHFRMGYAYTLALIAFLFWYSRRNLPELRHRDDLFLFIGTGLAGSAFWLANLYFVHNQQITLVYFIMRIFYLIKPLLIVLTVMVASSVYRSPRSASEKLIMFLMLMAPAAFSPVVALIIVFGAVCCLAGLRWWPLAVALSLAGFVGMVAAIYSPPPLRYIWYLMTDMGGNELNSAQIVMLLLCLTIMILRRAAPCAIESGEDAGGRRQRLLLAMPITLVVLLIVAPRELLPALRTVLHNDWKGAFSRAGYWGIREKMPGYAELVDWARLQSGRLFAVPPNDKRFMNFRYLSGKGLYALQTDINQLAYSPDYYYPAYARLLLLGLIADDSPKYRWPWAYPNLCSEVMRNPAVDYAVFTKQFPMPRECGSAAVLFENGEFIVYGRAN